MVALPHCATTVCSLPAGIPRIAPDVRPIILISQGSTRAGSIRPWGEAGWRVAWYTGVHSLPEGGGLEDERTIRRARPGKGPKGDPCDPSASSVRD